MLLIVFLQYEFIVAVAGVRILEIFNWEKNKNTNLLEVWCKNSKQFETGLLVTRRAQTKMFIKVKYGGEKLLSPKRTT